MNYYNEWDKPTAAWLRELIKAGLLPAGDVDERSITETKAHELAKYTQCHFFAGIGGWSLALQLAGWPADRPVWTGSCPCQPFSNGGKQMGFADPRHLWPSFRRLINRGRPPEIYGEQVASSLGREWLGGVMSDLETMGYPAAGADLCAASVGAPHKRQRLYWYGSNRERQGTPRLEQGTDIGIAGQWDWRGQEDLQQLYGRPTERGRVWPESIIRRMAHGFSCRVDLIRGYGNAIVPQAAAQFIRATQEARADI